MPLGLDWRNVLGSPPLAVNMAIRSESEGLVPRYVPPTVMLLTLSAVTVSLVSISKIESVPETESPESVSVSDSAALSPAPTVISGASFAPTTVMVKVVVAVAPCESVIVYVKVSVTVSPTASACTVPLVLSRV